MTDVAHPPEECEVCGWPLAGQGEHVSRAPTAAGMHAVHVCRLCWAIGTARLAHYPERYDAAAGLVIRAVCYVGNTALSGSLGNLASVEGIAARIGTHWEVRFGGRPPTSGQPALIWVECACGWQGSAPPGPDEVDVVAALRPLHARHVAEVIAQGL